jgi:hypothetical protein
MKVKVRVLKFGTHASDGSQVSENTIRDYLNTPEAQESIKTHRMLGGLTHRIRNINASGFSEATCKALKTTIGKDDTGLLIDSGITFTHYVTDLFIENGALWAIIQILPEDGFDDKTVQAIRRIKSLLKNSSIGVSCVLVGMWSGMKNGVDNLERLVYFKGVDFTLNPSFPGSYVTEVMDDENNVIKSFELEKSFSESEDRFDGYRVKTFSNLNELGLEINTPKTSKINNQFTILKAKSYSMFEDIEVVNEEAPKIEQKEFSQAHIIERTRLGKLSPRIRFRRLIMDYRQALKSQGGPEKISPEALKIMKSLFTTDLIGIMQEISPMIIQGKNLNALLGASSLGVEVRKAAQNMQIPYRLAMMENSRSGFVSKMRYQKIQEAYTEFVKSILRYVFETPTSVNLKEEEEDKNEQN